MTSIAVTARKCAIASEVALLVACFMPFLSLDLGMTHRCAKRARLSVINWEHPTTRIRLFESPLGEY